MSFLTFQVSGMFKEEPIEWTDLPASTAITSNTTVSNAAGIYRVSGSGVTLTITSFRSGYPVTIVNEDPTNSVALDFNGVPSLAFYHAGTLHSFETITMRPGEFLTFIDYVLVDGRAYP